MSKKSMRAFIPTTLFKIIAIAILIFFGGVTGMPDGSWPVSIAPVQAAI
jgi:hypothetical protein